MALWALVSFGIMFGLIVLAHRSEGGETLGVKQALYLGAVCAFMVGGYNVYQWKSAQTAPAEVEAYVPLYPNSQLKTRVPVRQLKSIKNLLSTQVVEDPVRGQWIFETEDSTADVGKYYGQWSRIAPHEVGVELKQESTEVLVDDPNYTMSILANDHWGRTRITYTLMAPID